MRQTAARLNRAWLTIIGILLISAGLFVVAVGTGLLARGLKQVGMSWSRPGPSNHVFGAGSRSAFGLDWVIVVAGVVGLILALLGLVWLIAQIPRSNQTKPLRLHDDAKTGLTRCAPSVLTSAVEDQIKALPGVQNASAVLRGSARQPDLTVRVTADDRTDLPRLLTQLQNQVAVDLGDSLDTKLARLGVQIEIDTVKVRTDKISI